MSNLSGLGLEVCIAPSPRSGIVSGLRPRFWLCLGHALATWAAIHRHSLGELSCRRLPVGGSCKRADADMRRGTPAPRIETQVRRMRRHQGRAPKSLCPLADARDLALRELCGSPAALDRCGRRNVGLAFLWVAA